MAWQLYQGDALETLKQKGEEQVKVWVNNFDGGLYLSFEESEVEHDAML